MLPKTVPSQVTMVRDVPRQLRFYIYLLLIAAASSTGLARIVTLSGSQIPARGETRPAYSPMLSANDRSRWCMVWSLAERGTFQIDEIMQQRGWFTIDHLKFEDGHFYSTKPPLLQVIVAGMCRLIKQCTGLTLFDHTHQVVQFILVLLNWLPMIVSLALLVQIGERYARTDWAKLYLVVAAAWGTFLTTFLVTFNNHTVAAWSTLLAIYAALRILDGERSWRLFAVAGFFTGFTACNELPAALFAVAICALLARSSLRNTLGFFVPAAVIPIAALLCTQYLETGEFKPLYTYYGTKYYNYVNENGKQSYWMNPTGIDRGLDSPATYFLHMTIGHHGIFSLTPMFLLTLAGWFSVRRKESQELRPILLLSCFLTVALAGFYLSRTENYNYGGHTSGLRWTFWLIPLWLIGMIPVLDRWAEKRWFRWTSAALLAISVFSAAWANSNPWQHPWLFVLMEQWGWINYSG